MAAATWAEGEEKLSCAAQPSRTRRAPPSSHPLSFTYRSPIVRLSFTPPSRTPRRALTCRLSSCAFRLPASLSVRFSKQSRQFSKFCTQCLMVYFLAGRSPAAAVDFVLGRGWASKSKCLGQSIPPDSPLALTIREDVERAVCSSPPSAFAALQTDPLTQFEFSDWLSAHRYVMELNLYNWIAGQNSAQGVAPSREQVFAQFPAQISVHAPVQIKERLRRLARGSARKQRKWLARFRGRWGARLGVLRVQEHVSLEDRRVKVGVAGSSISLAVPCLQI